MHLTFLDILEQCFHNKFRGYNKQEVDTFLQLVADDFKSLAEDIEEKDRQIKKLEQRLNEYSRQKSGTTPDVEEELWALRKELEEKDLLIQEMKRANEHQSKGHNPLSQLTPEMLKEEAKKIIDTAKQHAEKHKANAAKELGSLQMEIQKLQKQKQQLMDNIRATAVKHLNKFKTGT